MGRRLADMPVHSIASGLDYPSVGPEHPFLKDSGRVQYFTASDCEAVDAFYMLSRLEGSSPRWRARTRWRMRSGFRGRSRSSRAASWSTCPGAGTRTLIT